ncbi:hypothetical protein DFP72DRAFT_1060448 [Ephemerocybe angulata]|uniref:Uncharacterized protein n=1 Tax=Ephemerocybe angulata TaxID=980116 RepID=A0A8H6ID36_9AGAR|nr:hypothetical protein DFP72DRAFT_1060448 [Tulosesus angulatus]
MANGPPPSAAESSGSASSRQYESYIASATPSLAAQPQSQHPGYHATPSSASSSNPTSSTNVPGDNHWSEFSQQYNYGSWPAMQWSGYPTSTMSYPSSSTMPATGHYNYQSYYPSTTTAASALHLPSYVPPVPSNSPGSFVPKQEEREAKIPAAQVQPIVVPPPTPPPPLKDYRHWDKALKDFFREAGLFETLKGFESDVLIMSSDWEEDRIPKALQTLVKRLSGVSEYPKMNPTNSDPDTAMSVDEDDQTKDARIPLEDRKLTYLKLAEGEIPRTRTSINKSISQLLAKNRAKINESNRSEFLYSMSERRQKIQEATSDTPTTVDPALLGSCARTDAKSIDRDEQFRYDVVKNTGDGPLSRTMKAGETKVDEAIAEARVKSESGNLSTEELLRRAQDEERLTASRYPALDERLKNVESHFAVRFDSSCLEEHIIKLEKEYPPWAALHFNQPNRGWPAPPRTTPIIVPPSLRPKEDAPLTTASNAKAKPVESVPPPMESFDTPSTSSSTKSAAASGIAENLAKAKARNSKSSLHRAVMEKLQVQQAMNELGEGGGS